MEWHTIYNKVSPSVVKIETPSGHGTGFICHYSANQQLMAIATAHHVIAHAHQWQQPIRIVSHKTTLLFSGSERVIVVDPHKDSAMILTAKKAELDPPDDLIPFQEEGYVVRVGVEVGWIGFPAIGTSDKHFFSGTISAFNEETGSYFIDGVAINGVSGGPVFTEVVHEDEDKQTRRELQVIGSISAYIPNRATGEVFPGLSLAADLRAMHTMVKQFKTLRDAQETDPPKVEEAQETDPKA